MQLPSEVLGQVVGASRGGGAQSGQDRRRAARVRLSIPTTVFDVGDVASEGVVGIIQDISATGMSLVCPRSLPSGARFIAKLPRGNEPALWGAYTVVRQSALGRELFIIGAEFNGLTGEPKH